MLQLRQPHSPETVAGLPPPSGGLHPGYARWVSRRRLGKAQRAQHRGGSLGTLRFAQPTPLVRRPAGPVVQPIAELGAAHIAISIVVACEIRFGLAKSGSRRLAENMGKVMAELEVLPLEPPVEEHYAEIRATRERAGTPIDPNDLLIAAHARALGMILVSDNAGEFARVPGLRVENWSR